MREVAEALELAATLPGVNVVTEEYVRLLGFPRGWQLEGRPLELAEWGPRLVRKERPSVDLRPPG